MIIHKKYFILGNEYPMDEQKLLNLTLFSGVWENEFEDKFSYKLGKLHSYNDIPAINYSRGGQYWYKDGKFHREDNKPAAIPRNGYIYWYKNGLLHREDGPAVTNVFHNISDEYWLNGEIYEIPFFWFLTKLFLKLKKYIYKKRTFI